MFQKILSGIVYAVAVTSMAIVIATTTCMDQPDETLGDAGPDDADAGQCLVTENPRMGLPVGVRPFPISIVPGGR